MESWILRVSCKGNVKLEVHLLCRRLKVFMISWTFQKLNSFLSTGHFAWVWRIWLNITQYFFLSVIDISKQTNAYKGYGSVCTLISSYLWSLIQTTFYHNSVAKFTIKAPITTATDDNYFSTSFLIFEDDSHALFAIFVKKKQNKKLSSAANYRWRLTLPKCKKRVHRDVSIKYSHEWPIELLGTKEHVCVFWKLMKKSKYSQGRWHIVSPWMDNRTAAHIRTRLCFLKINEKANTARNVGIKYFHEWPIELLRT